MHAPCICLTECGVYRVYMGVKWHIDVDKGLVLWCTAKPQVWNCSERIPVCTE